MFQPEECFSLLRRYHDASGNYAKFETDVLGVVGFQGMKCPLVAIRIGSGPKKVLITAGIHGDERAATEALARFIESTQTPKFLEEFSVTLLPLLNPAGFSRNIRKNGSVDLNRHFGCDCSAKENQFVEKYLNGKSFDLMISLHEDVDMDSFYMYETGSFDARRLKHIIDDDVSFLKNVEDAGVPLNMERKIYGVLNRGGIKIVSQLDGKNLEKYLWARDIVKRVVTTETPGKLDFEKRVDIQVLAIRHFLKSFLV